ncbi:MAG: flagellar biosynthesis protein FlhF [Lachnospiraceae bacterium]|nr:flagellar biosynthesis protein FlhF [Lachnospiraceae bacterium]
MVIKKFHAPTEAEAVLKAKEEMGSSAVVLNVKTVKHRGIAKLFKKDYVEITAALEEKIYVTGDIPQKTIDEAARKNEDMNHEDVQRTSAIEEKLNNLQSLLENKMKEDIDNLREEEKEEEDEKIKFLKLIYHQLIENEVDEKYANQIIAEIQNSIKKDTNVDTILASVYQKIILKLGQPKTITLNEGKQKAVFFIGPTGVGKTTTIAKIAAHFKLEKNVKVALITADTYRIAAVEQLKTYANIIDIPLKVVYTLEEFNQSVKEYADYDLILIDTAGRSHKNDEQCEELYHLLEDCSLPENVEKENYVVLSATTKYKDLLRIIDVFGRVKDYSIIFTKIDETMCLGNILNIRLYSGAALSYIADGQSVPDDISTIDPQMIAKNVMAQNKK